MMLGGAEAAMALVGGDGNPSGITALVNCGVDEFKVPEGLLCHTVPVYYKGVSSSKVPRTALGDSLLEAVEQIHSWLQQGHRVLLFCPTGKDASVCVLIAVLLLAFDRGLALLPLVQDPDILTITKIMVNAALQTVASIAPSSAPNSFNLCQVNRVLCSSAKDHACERAM